MRRMMTVVAVVHGYDDGEGAMVEVYPYDPSEVGGGKASELMASWRPQPGELDDATAVKGRMAGLRGGSEPDRTIGQRPRAAHGFVDVVRESELSAARGASGDNHSRVYDEAYEYEIGEVMLFDAEVDPHKMKVDWSTAREHVPPELAAPTLDSAQAPATGESRKTGVSSVLAKGVTPLVAVGAAGGKAAAAAARRHGPAVMSAARTKLADPAVQAQLRTVATTAIEVGLASKGGRGAQVASKAATAMRVGDSVMAARQRAGSSGAGRAVLSPAAAAVLGSVASSGAGGSVRPAPRPQPGL